MTRAVTAQRHKLVEAPAVEPRRERRSARRTAQSSAVADTRPAQALRTTGQPRAVALGQQGQTEKDARQLGDYNLYNG
jgi:hypothetical protein